MVLFRTRHVCIPTYDPLALSRPFRQQLSSLTFVFGDEQQLISSNSHPLRLNFSNPLLFLIPDRSESSFFLRSSTAVTRKWRMIIVPAATLLCSEIFSISVIENPMLWSFFFGYVPSDLPNLNYLCSKMTTQQCCLFFDLSPPTTDQIHLSSQPLWRHGMVIYF